jgi:hypothetical protein
MIPAEVLQKINLRKCSKALLCTESRNNVYKFSRNYMKRMIQAFHIVALGQRNTVHTLASSIALGTCCVTRCPL